MSDFIDQKTFRKIFHKDVIIDDISFTDKSRRKYYSITLNEKENKEKKETKETKKGLLKDVQIVGFDKIHFAIDYDKYFFLADENKEDKENCLLIAPDIRKACDTIIWGEFQGKNILLLVELKSFNNEHITSKFKSSQAFIDYFNSIVKTYYNPNNIEFQSVYVLINRNVCKPSKVGTFNEHTENEITFYHKGIKKGSGYDVQMHDLMRCVENI